MALVLECKNYDIFIEQYDLSNVNILSTYPTATFRYYLQYTNCCGGSNVTLRLDTRPDWSPGSNPNTILPQFTVSSYGFSPVVYVQRISDGQTFIPLDYLSGGWVSISAPYGTPSPSCFTTTTTTTTATPTTTKNPINVIFNSCCDASATFSSLLTQYWGNQKVICLKDPIQNVYLISGTGSQLINSGSWSNYFLSETVTNPGPSCSCDCATQSIGCTRIRVTSTEQNVFRYLECSSGFLVDQMLVPKNFLVNEQATLIAMPSTCSVGITTATATVNFNISQGTLVNNFVGGSASSILYTGPFGNFMSSTNSIYTAGTAGVYYIQSEIESSYIAAGNATNSLIAKLQKNSGGVVSLLDSSSWTLYYNDAQNYTGTMSIQLGFSTYSLLQGDKVYVEISKNSNLIAATYSSSVCQSGQVLTVYATSSGGSPENNTSFDISYNIGDPITEIYSQRYRLKFGHPPAQTNWSGSTYSFPSSGGYTFSWNISGSFSITSSSGVDQFTIQVIPLSNRNFFYGYQEKTFDTNVSNQSFNFTESNYSQTLNQGEVGDLLMVVRLQATSLPNATLNLNLTIDNGSVFSISSVPRWASEVRNLTYFEVLLSPTFSSQSTAWGYDFCARTPLQNQPPIQRISGSYTYSVCSTPGSIYFPACSPALSYTCGTYTRSFVEISGTQCLWPTTTSTTTLSGGGGGGSP